MPKPQQHHKPVIGLTGGLGAGKTTVASEFAKLRCAVISADKLNHELLDQPEIIAQLTTWWGPAILNPQGLIDHDALGNIVFGQPDQIKKLNDLLHPLIAAKQDLLIELYQNDPQVKAIILDVPLLLEVGQNSLCDRVIFIETDQAVRCDRLSQHRGWDKKKIKKIENLQFSLDIKAKMSDHTVQNNSSICDVAVQAAKLLSEILQD